MDRLKLERNIEELFSGMADPGYAQREKDSHQVNGFSSLGISTVALRKKIKPILRESRSLCLESAMEFAEHFYEKGIEEYFLVANMILCEKFNQLEEQHLERISSLASKLNSWSNVDDYCLLVFQPLLFKFEQKGEQILRAWNQSERIWLVRCSVVCLTRNAGTDSQWIDLAMELCENLVFDQRDLVRKAVGWCLKDQMRGNKSRVFEYVKDLRRRGVSSVITLYAIRDIKGPERKEVLAIR